MHRRRRPLHADYGTFTALLIDVAVDNASLAPKIRDIFAGCFEEVPISIFRCACYLEGNVAADRRSFFLRSLFMECHHGASSAASRFGTAAGRQFRMWMPTMPMTMVSARNATATHPAVATFRVLPR